MSNIDVSQLVSQITSIITTVIGVALLVLIAGTVAGKFGLRASVLPQMQEQALAWLCGAWWLYRGGKL